MATDYTNFEAGRTWEALLPSAARTATPNVQQIDIKTPETGGIIFVVNVTAVGAAGSVTAKIEGVDPATQAVWPILTAANGSSPNGSVIGPVSAGLGGVATYVYKVHPSTPTSTTVKVQHAQDVVPPVVRFTLTHATADSYTYSVTVIVDGD